MLYTILRARQSITTIKLLTKNPTTQQKVSSNEKFSAGVATILLSIGLILLYCNLVAGQTYNWGERVAMAYGHDFQLGRRDILSSNGSPNTLKLRYCIRPYIAESEFSSQ